MLEVVLANYYVVLPLVLIVAIASAELGRRPLPSTAQRSRSGDVTPGEETIPSGLRLSPPRTLRARLLLGTNTPVGLLVSVMLLLGGGYSAISSAIDLLVVMATPEVSGVVSRKMERVYPTLKSKFWFHTIEFMLWNNDEMFISRQDVEWVTFKALRVGNPVAAHAATVGSTRYVTLYLGPWWYVSEHSSWWLLATAGCLLGAIGIRITWWNPRRLVRDGVPILGTICERQVVSSRDNVCVVSYTYHVGGLRRGAMRVRAADFDSAQPCARVVVLYDVKRPDRSILYSYAGYEAC